MAELTVEKSKQKPQKTTLRKNAETSLTAEDLIHPHESSNLPGYCGYTHQLKFNCGHTYGYQTDKLTNKYTRNEKLETTRPGLSGVKTYLLPQEGGGDKKYVEKMVPGYTGYVPQHVFTYGKTYKEGTEDSIATFTYDTLKRKGELDALKHTVKSYPKLFVNPDFPPSDPSHPGVNVRYAYSNFGKHFDERRAFTEAPLPGYKGYVPRHEEHKLGSRYGIWTRHAYGDSLHTTLTEERSRTEMIDVSKYKPIPKHSHTSTWPLADTGNSRFGSVYNKRLGMVPNYTGFVPQRRFDFGETYGDSTRLLPVCKDTSGYATGRYNIPGPPIERTVIPVRI